MTVDQSPNAQELLSNDYTHLDTSALTVAMLECLTKIVVILLLVFVIYGVNTVWPLLGFLNLPQPQALLDYVHPIHLLVAVAAISAWLIARTMVEHRNYAFKLDVAGLHRKSGFLSRSYAVIPRNRVQNVGIARTFRQRTFELSTLLVFTAGSDLNRLSIRNIPYKEAQRILQDLLDEVQRENQSD